MIPAIRPALPLRPRLDNMGENQKGPEELAISERDYSWRDWVCTGGKW